MPSSKSGNKPKPSEPPQPVHVWSFEAIGTLWWVALYALPADVDLVQIALAIEHRIEQFDAIYSRFRDDSLVSLWARTPGEYPMPADAEPLFGLYHKLYQLSDGAVTPLIGQVMADAGYDATYSLQSTLELASPPPWDEALDYTSETLTIKKPVLLDFGAAGKGYLVDIITELLESAGITSYCVDAGGDLRYSHDSEPLTVGLEHPEDPTMAVGTAHLSGLVHGKTTGAGDKAICGSSGNRRTWGDFHHIIDPMSLQSPTHLKAVWVTAGSAMLADGLATALFFVSPVKLVEDFKFSYAMIREDLSWTKSAEFPGEFFGSSDI